MQVPLFPLNTVLFPGGVVPLRIFETRYIDMVSRCLREDQPFGVLLIREGHEVGTASTFDIGTLARIADWYQGSDGVLGVTAIGERRFRLLSSGRQHDGLNLGEVRILADEPATALPEELGELAVILAGVLDDLGKLYASLERRLDDAGWVSARFLEILPLDLELKQQCLEQADPLDRLRLVRSILDASRGSPGPG